MRVDPAKKRKAERGTGQGIFLMLALLFCAFFAALVPEENVRAYDEVNSISVTVGYWGDGEGKVAYTKQTVDLDELAAECGTHRIIYTWLKGNYKPGLTEAEGVYISDLMDYCNIDMDSVMYYNFYTVDAASYSAANQQWSNDQLFSERYSYSPCFEKFVKNYQEWIDSGGESRDFIENPERHYTIYDFFDFKHNEFDDQEAWNNRIAVEPMLALKIRSSTWDSYIPQSDLDFTYLSKTGRPTLMFGERGLNDITHNLHAQMVFRIHIWFEGSPSITLSESELTGKVGSKKKIKVNVDTPDSFLTQKVMDDVSLKSEDSSIAKVNSDGSVTIKGEGQTTLTATYNGKVVGTVTVTGSGKIEDDDSGGGDSGGGGSGGGSGKGKGKGSGKGGSGSGSGSSGSGSNKSTGGIDNGAASGNSIIPSDSTSGTSSSILRAASGAQAGGKQENDQKNTETDTAEDNGETVYEISQPAEELTQTEDTKNMLKYVFSGMAGALLLGMMGQGLVFRGQVNWKKKAERAYKKK